MKTRMQKVLWQEEDPRILGHGEIFDTYGYSQEKAWNFYERFMAGEFTPDDTEWVNPSDYEAHPLD